MIMAFLMLLSSTVVAMDMHYCGGELKSFSFLGEAKNCHELKAETTKKYCPHHGKMMVMKKACSEDKNCCSDKTVRLLSDQDQQVKTPDLLMAKQFKTFIIAFTLVFLNTELLVDNDTLVWARYKPPSLPKDIPILHQSFLL